jgi:hypothetical protein
MKILVKSIHIPGSGPHYPPLKKHENKFIPFVFHENTGQINAGIHIHVARQWASLSLPHTLKIHFKFNSKLNLYTTQTKKGLIYE